MIRFDPVNEEKLRIVRHQLAEALDDERAGNHRRAEGSAWLAAEWLALAVNAEPIAKASS